MIAFPDTAALGLLYSLPWVWLALAIGSGLYVNANASRRGVKRAGVWILIVVVSPVLGLLLYVALAKGANEK
jgi:hypothetical protein